MANYKVDDIRNLALVGHGAAGKTSLADALLAKAGAVDRRGSVDEGTSVSDFDEEEKKRRISIDSSVLHLESQGKMVHLLDTPGYADFVGAALGALEAVEAAIVVLSAPNGIEVNARRMFAEAGRRGLARLLVINKLDADNIKFPELVAQIQESFGKNCVLFNVPDAVGPAFSRVLSVLQPPAQVPAGCPVDLAAARSKLIDAIVESDDALMEKYLMEGTVSAEELTAAIPKAVASGTVIPIFCTAAKKDIGIAELLDAIVRYAPSPSQGRRWTGTKGTGDKAQEVTIEPSESGELVGLVFKALSDKFVGNLSFIRIVSGRLTSDQPLVNLRTGKSSRTGGLLLVQGKGQKSIPEAIAGDIIAVAKVEDLAIGDTVATSANAPRLPRPVFPTPMFGLAVEPKSRGDEQKISGSLQKIADEDPTFKITRDPQTKELVINGMSQLHLDVVQQRLKRRYDLEIITKEPKIPYRETIAAEGAADYRHKKQTGGAGQFGEVHLRVYPLPSDITTEEECRARFMNKERFPEIREEYCRYEPEYNFAFVDCIVGGSIPNQFMPAVYKGCMEVMEQGAVAGYRMQNIGVEVYFGKSHPVDSKEVAFKTAGRMAFKKAILTARPAILEPIVTLEVTVPSKYTGAILGDLNTKRGRIENQDSLPGDLAVIVAKVPLAEVTRYKATLDSITQGQGSYTMEFSHYDVVPGNIQQQIISKAKVAVEEED
ncbi:MAG: elongation factor G [Gemmataceae bacterium]|nr:elongation factor G [Gemmataceae bacterium]MDW8266837.1 elongation factor G [Gemmataceae bacterium]